MPARTRTRTRRAISSAQSSTQENAPAQAPTRRGLPQDLAEFKATVDKAHGEGIVETGGKLPRVNHIPTGCFIIDLALLGGLPQGHATMAYGYHSTAKTTLFLNAVAEYQRKHPEMWVAWVDTESLYDAGWAKTLGVDLDRLLHIRPDHGEQAVDMIEDLLQRPSIGVIVLDSVPATVPMKVLDNSAEDDTMAAGARLMGKLCSKYVVASNKEKRKGHWVSFWYVNQLREKVGFTMGSTRHLPGGKQINHIATTKIWLKLIKENMKKDSNDIETPDFNAQGFKLEKTKHGSSLKEGEFQLCLDPENSTVGMGKYDNVHAVITFGKKMGFITGGGASWRCLTSLSETKRFKKLSEIEEWLASDQEEYDTLARSIIAHQRVLKGLTALPPDQYLVSPHGRLILLS